MIIGNGLLATTLKDYKYIKDVIIFASGVSNSSETNEANFRREEELILANCKLNIPIVYFSTCSIFDESIRENPYIIHKLKMEKLIMVRFQSYYILRLPTVLGITKNPHTFYNSIVSKLKKSEPVTVFKNASRYLLDVDDLIWIIPLVLKQNNNKQIINITFDNKVSVHEIVLYLQNKLQSKSEIIFVSKGSDLKVDNSEFKKLYSKTDSVIKSDIYYEILDKYLYI